MKSKGGKKKPAKKVSVRKVWYITKWLVRFELPQRELKGRMKTYKIKPLVFTRSFVRGSDDMTVCFMQELEALWRSPDRHLLRSAFEDMKHMAANRSLKYRGFMLNTKLEPATPGDIGGIIGTDAKLARKVLAQLCKIGLMEYIECPDFASMANDHNRFPPTADDDDDGNDDGNDDGGGDGGGAPDEPDEKPANGGKNGDDDKPRKNSGKKQKKKEKHSRTRSKTGTGNGNGKRKKKIKTGKKKTKTGAKGLQPEPGRGAGANSKGQGAPHSRMATDGPEPEQGVVVGVPGGLPSMPAEGAAGDVSSPGHVPEPDQAAQASQDGSGSTSLDGTVNVPTEGDQGLSDHSGVQAGQIADDVPEPVHPTEPDGSETSGLLDTETDGTGVAGQHGSPPGRHLAGRLDELYGADGRAFALELLRRSGYPGDLDSEEGRSEIASFAIAWRGVCSMGLAPSKVMGIWDKMMIEADRHKVKRYTTKWKVSCEASLRYLMNKRVDSIRGSPAA